jgi:hypothetical protein
MKYNKPQAHCIALPKTESSVDVCPQAALQNPSQNASVQ